MSSIIAGITKDLKAVPENLKAKAKGADAKKLLLLNVPYILAGYFCDKVAWLWRVSEGADASAKMIAAMNGFDTLFSNPLPSFHPRDLLIGAGCGIALRLVVYYKAKNAKKFRHGKEYGSARKPNSPQHEAGIRTEPPPSEPCAAATIPAATAAPDPPDDPPEVRSRFQGLRVGPP